MRSFNVYDFENYLIVEFIAGKTLTEITAHFDRRLLYDPDFAKRYEKCNRTKQLAELIRKVRKWLREIIKKKRQKQANRV